VTATRPGTALLATGLLTLGLLAGCVPAAERKARAMEGRYALGDAGEGWAKVDAGSADLAWYNDGLGATIYADSNCGKRYKEARPEDLATELEGGLRNREAVSDTPVTMDDRHGVQRVTRGEMDGVPVQIAFTVVNRSWCTYDLTYIAAPAQFDAGWDAYARVVSGFDPR
jgi:hypothetical protein